MQGKNFKRFCAVHSAFESIVRPRHDIAVFTFMLSKRL